MDENSFRPLQKTPPYSKIDFIRTGENNDKNLSYVNTIIFIKITL